MKTTTCILALSLSVAGVARADVIPPDMESCTGKTAGTACTYFGQEGSCTNSTCSKLDYSKWDRDASTSPPSTSYACIVCKTGTATQTTTTKPVTDTSVVTPTVTTTDTSVVTPTITTTDTSVVTPTVTTTDTSVVTPTITTTDTSVVTPTITTTDTSVVTPTSIATDTSVFAPTSTTTNTNTQSEIPIPQTTTTIPSTDNGTTHDDKQDGGCQIGGVSMRRVVPWMLAGSFSLLFLFARRRRSR